MTGRTCGFGLRKIIEATFMNRIQRRKDERGTEGHGKGLYRASVIVVA